MFENIIGQPVIKTLKNDLAANTLPPSILFAGEIAGAKASSALELARVLSCTASDTIDIKKTALWGCSCPSCEHHRHLSHPDLICIGPRVFQAEINAGKTLFLRDPDKIERKMFFQRAVRKLLLRFSPVIWEGESKISKLNKTLEDIEDNMEALVQGGKKEEAKREKILNAIVENAQKLELEGITETIPVSHIRNASYWLRTTPNGRRKILIIENAEKMNDSARNSLLKILEEPPESAAIILTSSKPDSLLPTILSRLRNYSFSRRSAESEIDIISRVFHDDNYISQLKNQAENSNPDRADSDKHEDQEHKKRAAPVKKSNLISLYLDTFLPVSAQSLYPAAAYFLASAAAGVVLTQRKKNPQTRIPPELIMIGQYTSPIAENAGFGRPSSDIKTMVGAVRLAAGKFETRGLYGNFLEKICALLLESLRGEVGTLSIAYREAAKKALEESRAATGIYNQQIELALERLASQLIASFSNAGALI
ncbi:MAG: DNA polymerase III [Spirochaetaceae bacterium]|jgi:DNA polymerase-3 subunit gamma/tau|nr:DNA polymerase III [Spirochaetaceae bacterium]